MLTNPQEVALRNLIRAAEAVDEDNTESNRQLLHDVISDIYDSDANLELGMEITDVQ